ncbi:MULTISPECIES: roadblock/LC7 domain-containing protein [Pseudomonas]|jgi:predicted regulator of Ras-like GTPase activity (Roadblock/LC7/MglB family)|uniref:Roadblock/LC7 domain-containing protein n=1 Tax=Pseudomonas citronellolis TaxID=53408 RepID=A0A127MWU0_9PSED|nr:MULTISPECIES: roadblock/LC7 domain-containing protein [Pseudomonas]KSW23030.1 hypothetical protein AOX63_06385 [Pseudomonas sp. ADP]AMO77784.1 Roadblock/LC7 domain protein [Pseudomonas citronellolis]ANI16458.1 hypothetical protein A9C11_21900 [Pseudomonas citronellolis]KES23280.1 hypothetical protein FG99_17175 [Pseudomonas sp. AAC]KRV81243.1 hypothetical protein AO742_01335 [Pseudomonas citronellolis]
MTRQERLQAELDRLRQSVPSIRGVLLGSLDGMPIVDAISDHGIEPARIAAMAAAALGVGRRIGETLKSGAMKELSLLAEDGRVFIHLAGDKACLAIVAARDSNVGLINLEVADSLATLDSIL